MEDEAQRRRGDEKASGEKTKYISVLCGAFHLPYFFFFVDGGLLW